MWRGIITGLILLGALGWCWAAGESQPPTALFPFVLPWDDATPGVANISGWLHKPAGKFGHVRVTSDDQAAPALDSTGTSREKDVYFTLRKSITLGESLSNTALRLATFTPVSPGSAFSPIINAVLAPLSLTVRWFTTTWSQLSRKTVG